jgi:hypothetical protein
MALNSYVRDTAKVRDFIEEVAKCQTHFAFLELQKKRRNPERLRQIHQRRRVEETNSGAPGTASSAHRKKYYGDNFCAAQDIFVRRGIPAESRRQARYSLAFDDRDNRQKGEGTCTAK